MISSMKFLGGYKIFRRKFLATPDHSYFPDLYRGDEALASMCMWKSRLSELPMNVNC